MSSRYLLLAVAALGLALTQPADASDFTTLYDVNFAFPTHINGQPPQTGDGPIPRNTVSLIRFGDPVIAQPFGASWLVLAAPGDPYDQVSFTGNGIARYQRYTVEIDLGMRLEPGNSLAIFIDTPLIKRFSFLPGGDISFTAGGAAQTVGSWTPITITTFRAEFDVETGVFEAWYGSTKIVSQVVSDIEYFSSVRLSAQGDDYTVVVDQVTIEGWPVVVPTLSRSWGQIKAQF